MPEPYDASPQLKAIEDIVSAIGNLDTAIEGYSRILDVIQPYAPGKISIRFITLSGGRKPAPTFVVWLWTPTGRQLKQIKHYKTIRQEAAHLYIKSYGPFAGTESDVRAIIADAKKLMDRRRALTASLGRFTQSALPALRHTNATLEQIQTGFGERILDYHQRHMARMDVWHAKKADQAADEAVREARHAVPDPHDIVDAEPPPKPAMQFDEDQHALPVDENGNYIEES